MRRGLLTVLMTLMVAGCMTTHSDLGVIRPSAEEVGLKMLRPGARARECRSSLFGIPLQVDGADSLLATVLKLDDEADVLAKARVKVESISTGVYNRTCVELVGDLGREVSVVRLPAVGGGHQHHH
jgi:hypothetical protein